MADNCPICYQPIKALQKCKMRDGVVHRSCYSQSVLASAGYPPHTIEVWELCVLNELDTDGKQAYLLSKQKAQQQDDAAREARKTEVLAQESLPRPPVSCPKCGSQSITANKKGYGIGKAVVGAAVIGPVGLLAGTVGAKKVQITCLNCGYSWLPGKR